MSSISNSSEITEQPSPHAGSSLHGFVLVGGRSSRMGQDKAVMPFGGRPMVETAVAKLAGFCSGGVSLVGNRDDLAAFAPVVHDDRHEAGPAGGIEAGLRAAEADWAVFIPVDVPLVPGAALRSWARTVLENEQKGVRLSYLRAGGERQPTFCMLHRSCAAAFTESLSSQGLKLDRIFENLDARLGSGALLVVEAETLGLANPPAETDSTATVVGPQDPEMKAWFSNVNTPEDLSALELWARRATATVR